MVIGEKLHNQMCFLAPTRRICCWVSSIIHPLTDCF